MRILMSVLLFFITSNIHAEMTHQSKVRKEWREEGVLPFDELILSWNGKRPSLGQLSLFVSLKVEEQWSPWLLYAVWERDSQSSFDNSSSHPAIRVYQDAAEVLEGKKASGFRVKVVPEGGASLKCLHALHAYTNGDKTAELAQIASCNSSVSLNVRGQSQMQLPHPRFADLCSPTSTASVVKYLLQDYTIDTVEFAANARDCGFDIYGNWVFNVVQASTLLGPKWDTWVERLNGFDGIYASLMKGVPVVVSLRGPLAGSALPYAKGHLLVITGYDPLTQVVLCMDPAFPTDEETIVRYDLLDFLQAWSRRGRVAYIFCEKKSPVHL